MYTKDGHFSIMDLVHIPKYLDTFSIPTNGRFTMRIVIKLGTSTLTHATGHLNIRRVELLAKVISDIEEGKFGL